MTRAFTIHENRNEQGFDRYFVKFYNGIPYEENPECIATSSKVELFKALVEWIEEGE